LSVSAARHAARPAAPAARIGLALAGGGPLGAIYEIGALCALDDALLGRRIVDLDGYVGVSAGGFIAAGLANGLGPRELWASFIANEGDPDDIFDPALLLRPAWRAYAQPLRNAPRALADALRAARPGGGGLGAVVDRLGALLPAGVFSTAAMGERLRRQFSRPGRSNDFRALKRRLVIVATELDSGESAAFGLPGRDHVPISKAVEASAALPGLYPPVAIEGRSYADGALKKTLHASVLLDEGLDLLIALNPLVPFDATRQGRERVMSAAKSPIPTLAEAGLPTVLSQTFRTLIHSRLELGLRGYAVSHPDTAIVLFEPDHRDSALYLANTFGTAHRRQLAEHAYQRTLADLRARRSELQMAFAKAGLSLDDAVLNNPAQRLDPGVAAQRPAAGVVRKLEDVLDDLERVLSQVRPRRG
jgi:NTE family protein